MSALLWPGDELAGPLFSDDAVVAAMVTVESAWLDALVAAGVAPESADLVPLTPAASDLAERATGGGNPVIPLVALLRDRLPEAAGRWVHRGLTSQDVLDTALVLCSREVCANLRENLRTQLASLADLIERHRTTAMVARTLTQPAVPSTFGAKAAAWTSGVLDAADELARAAERLPVQVGGAGATRAAVAALGGGSADAVVADFAARLDVPVSEPWHTGRAPLLRVADAWTLLTGAYTRIANDVLTLGRPEIGELGEPTAAGRGGSSAMPHKQNPVLSVLVRRAGLAAPSLTAALHLAAAEAVDERPDGAWHLEWQPLQLLARHAVTAAAQVTELVSALQVHDDRMAANLAASDVGSELRALEDLGADATAYAGAAAVLADRAASRARTWLESR